MRKIAPLTLAITLASSSVVFGQSVAPAPAVAPLIRDITIQNNDSLLVRAAKNAVANRMRESSRWTGVVINDAYVRHSAGRLSEATGSASIAAYPAPTTKDIEANKAPTALGAAPPRPAAQPQPQPAAMVQPGLNTPNYQATQQTRPNTTGPQASQNVSDIPRRP